jgi:hypothetical protein
MQLFDMCSYDVDSFREFIQTPGFRDVFDLDHAQLARLLAEEEELVRFSMRFLRQVLFGESSIPVKQGARERRIEQRKDQWDKRRKEEINAHRQRAQDELYDEDSA